MSFIKQGDTIVKVNSEENRQSGVVELQITIADKTATIPDYYIFGNTKIKHLPGVQEHAVDLYERGFNVFPIPSAYDWNLRGSAKKTPYILEPLFRNRMHYVEGCCCSTCTRHNFITLFERSNIAVMCGATSGNLVSIDCDSKEAFQRIGEELTARKIEFWAYTTYRGGQYLLRIIEGVISNVPKPSSLFTDVEIWGNRHFVVIPPSTHPTGVLYQWKSPEPLNMLPGDTLNPVSVDTLAWLGVKLKMHNKEDVDWGLLPEYARKLSRSNLNTFIHGVDEGQRNSALTALAADLAGIGVDEDTARDALENVAMNCHPSYNDPIEPILKWAFGKQRSPARRHEIKTGNVIQNWHRANAFAQSFDWHSEFGHKATYARRTFNGCIKRSSLDIRSNDFRASVREIAQLAQMSNTTASRYLRLLVDHGLLLPKGHEASGALLFSFSDRVTVIQDTNIDILLYQNYPTQNNILPESDAEKDAFDGLGTYAYQIWRELLLNPETSIYRIAKKLRLNKRTVSNTLKRLVGVGLVTYSQAECIYYADAFSQAQIDRLALDRGTAGRAKDKRAKADKDREKYVNRQISKAKSHHKRESAHLEEERAQYIHDNYLKADETF